MVRVDVREWIGVAPNALASGRVDSSTGAMAGNVITAAAIATDAGDEIADQVWDEARAGHVAGGSFGEGVASVQGNVTGSVASVTALVIANMTQISGDATAADNLELDYDGTGLTRANSTIGTVTALTGTVTVATMNAAVIDAASLAADALTSIGDSVWNEAEGEIGGAPLAGANFGDKLNWIFALSRNEITQTAGLQDLRDDATSGSIATAVVAEAAGTFTRSEWS
jgi:hypothetical protein